MKNKLLLLMVFLVLQTLYTVIANAAVYVSGNGSVAVTAVKYYDFADAEGNQKFRIVMDMSGPYYSDYETASGYEKTGYSAKVVFDNMTLSDDVGRQLRPVSKNADLIDFSEQHGALVVKTLSDTKEYAGSQVSVLQRSLLKPCQVVVDFSVDNSNILSGNVSGGVSGKTIVLDPGHGGSDTGAIGANGTTEKSVNFAIALKLRKCLIDGGAKVIMTRNGDFDVAYPNCSDEEELRARASFASRYKADIFVSLHNDAYYNRSSNGTATYYYVKTAEDKRLAEAIQKKLCMAIGLKDKGTRKANFYVIRNSQVPAVLVEVAFISNPNEERLLNSQDFQQQAADGICSGISDYFSGR